MQNIFSGKVFNVFKFICANGAGETGGGTSTALMSGLMTVLAGLLDLLSSLVSWLWGLVMTLLYNVVKLVLNIVDVLEFFVTKLVGIDIYKTPGWSNTISLKDSDMIIKLITSDTVLNLFGKICIIAGLLLMIFCIFSIVRENYKIAMGDEVKGNPATNALKKAVKSIFLCFLVPFLLIVGILGSNVILASVCAAIRGNNDLTVGGVIFTTSAYEANRYRLYASEGKRTPIYYSAASEIVNPSDYTETNDMMILFYDLVVGNTYIGSLSPEIQQNIDKGFYDDWYDDIKNLGLEAVNEDDYNDGSFLDGLGSIGETLVEVAGRTFLGSVWHSLNGVIDKLNGGVVAGADDSSASAMFSQAFATWYEDKFDSVPLDDLGMWNKHIRSIYNTNWSKNDDLSTSQVEFKSTYVKNSNNPLNFPSNGDVANVFVYTNSDSYSDYETFTTMEVEYYVMADVIDYAIEHNQKFYFINADSDKIQWTPMDYENNDDGEPDADKTIDTYNANACVFSYEDSTGKVNYLVADKDQLEDAGIKLEGGDYFVNNGSTPATKLSSDSFYVSYSDGGGGSINRLYWSEDGTLGERYGSTYIVCIAEVKEDGTETGKYLPVTQKTTNFRSSFLADDYAGPIVARGAFSSWGIVALGSKQYPTGLREQLVDADGTPIKTFESYNKNNSSYSLTPVVSTDKEGNLLANANYFYKASTFIDKLDTDGDDHDRVAEAVAGSTGIKGQLSDSIYYNSYISYYKMLDANTIEFYDASGSRMKRSSDSTGKDASKISAKTTGVNFDYIMNPDLLHNYYVKGELNDGDIEGLIAGSLDGSGVIEESDLIKIKYTGTLVTFTYNGTSISMLVDVKATKIEQGGSEATSGTFYIFSLYKNVGNDNFIDAVTGGVVIETAGDNENQVAIYHKEPVNLYIKNGEVYNATGTAFVTKTTASELKDSLVSSVKTITNEDIVNYLYAKTDVGYLKKSLSFNVLEKLTASNWKTVGNFIKSNDEASKIQYEKKGTYYQKQDDGSVVANGNFYTWSATGLVKVDFPTSGDALFVQDCEDLSGDEKTNALKIQARTIVASNGSCIDGDVQTARQSLIQELYKSIAIKYYGESGGRVAISFGSTISEFPSSRYVVSEEGTSPDIKYTITYKTSKGDINKTLENATSRVLGATTVGEITAYLGYDGDDGKWTNVKLYLTDPTTTGLATKKVDVTIKANVSYDLYTNGSNSMAINFALDSVDFNTSDDAKKYIKVQANAITCNGTVALSKTTITQLVAQGLNNTSIETQDDKGNNITFNNIDFLSALSLATYPTDTDRYVYFEYGSFGVLFSNIVLDFAFHLDLSNITSGFKIFAFRLRLGFVKSYQIKTSYHLENGGFILDYNFNRTRGIGITYLFDMKHINPLVLIFSTAIVFNMLWKMVWGLISRIYEIAIQFIILPGVLAVEVITPGKFSDWSGNVIKKVMVAYSSLIMINLYYALIPSISSLTDGLISWDDLPSTVTSMFGAIGNSISSIGGGKMLGNINVNFTNIISKVTEIFEDGYAGKTIAAFLNKIIFILFFLVLTTLTSKGKDLIGDYINSGDVVADGASTLGDVNKLKQDFKNNPVNKMVGAGVGLAKKGVAKHMAKKASIGGGGRSDFTADDLVEREVEETGDDIATAPARVSGSAEMTSLASALSGSGTSINLNFAPAVMGQRHRGEGVPLPSSTPQGEEEEQHSSSSGASVMNGSGGFGYGGDDGTSRPTHGSGTTYFGGGGGGSSRGAVDYYDAAQFIDPNMNLDQLRAEWERLRKEEKDSLKSAKDLMSQARAEYTNKDKAEHKQVRQEREELSKAVYTYPSAENFEKFTKVSERDVELTEKKRKSDELKEQARVQHDAYNVAKADREAYQLAIGRKIAAGTVTSDNLFALSEDQRDKSVDTNSTIDELAQKEAEHTQKAEESRKRKESAQADYDLNKDLQQEAEGRAQASQESIAEHKRTIAEHEAYIKELKAKLHDPNATKEEKDEAQNLIGMAQTIIGQENQYIQGEILKAQEAKQTIEQSKNAQQDALDEISSANKDIDTNTEEALKYGMEKERLEDLETRVTKGDLEALKSEINKRADAEKTGVLISEARQEIGGLKGEIDKKADAWSVNQNADVAKQAIEKLSQEKADSKSVSEKLNQKADADKVASALNSVGGAGGSGGGSGGTGGSGGSGRNKPKRKTLEEKKRELINQQLDLEEEVIKPGLFSWAKRAKNSVKRTKLRLQVGAISTVQATGDRAEKIKDGAVRGINFAGKWTLGKVQKGVDVIKNTRAGQTAMRAGHAVAGAARTVASIPGQVVDTVRDAIDNSQYMQNERERIANRQQTYADQHNEQIVTAEERVRNNQSRRFYSQGYAEEYERRRNTRNGGGTGNSNGGGTNNSSSTGGTSNRTSGTGTGNSSNNGNGGTRTSNSSNNGNGGNGASNQTTGTETGDSNSNGADSNGTNGTGGGNNATPQQSHLTKGQVAGRVVGTVIGGVAGYAVVSAFQNKKMKRKATQSQTNTSSETATSTENSTEQRNSEKAERQAQRTAEKAERQAEKLAEKQAEAERKAEEKQRKDAEREAKIKAEEQRQEEIAERKRQLEIEEIAEENRRRAQESAIQAQQRRAKINRTHEAHKSQNREKMGNKSRAQNRKK